MENNVISLEQKAADRNSILKKKAMHGIDNKELNDYYNKVVKGSIHHLSFLQKFVAEEYLGDTVIDSFAMGIEASKLRLDGKSVEGIVEVFATDLHSKLAELGGKHQLYQYLRENDIYSITIIAEDLSNQWFRKGIIYGEKQRKLRLM